MLQVSEAVLQSILKCLVSVVNSESAVLASVAMQALGHIGLRVPLPQLVNDSTAGSFRYLQIPVLVSSVRLHFASC